MIFKSFAPSSLHFNALSSQRLSKQLIIVVSAVLLSVFAINPAKAQEQSVPVIVGYRDFNFDGGGVTSQPTEAKPESKLWYNDGSWWGILWDPDPSVESYTIHQFSSDTQSWTSMGPLIDDRPRSSADVLWDGNKLYIAVRAKISHRPQDGPEDARLYRLSYDAISKTYSRDAGFPVEINDKRSDSLVMAKDSTGQIWVTWVQDANVMVNRSLGDDLTWGTPFVLPVQGSNPDSIDISSVIAFGGDKIGIMWSDQADPLVSSFYFAVHQDADEDSVWQARETALTDPGLGKIADEHINLATSADGNTVLAAVKTGLEKTNPGVFLLDRDPGGQWSRNEYSTGNLELTRPIVLVDSDTDSIYVFARSNKGQLGAKLYTKTTHLNNIQFEAGFGTTVIQSQFDSTTNNPTSTKQFVNQTTGLLVLASDRRKKYYLHTFDDLGTNLNQLPVAIDDSANVNPGIPVEIDVTGNDFDPDGTIDSTTVAIVQAPVNGIATLDSASGIITYTSNPDSLGNDSLLYRVADDAGDYSTFAKVTIIINPAPIALNDSSLTIVGRPIQIDVTANDSHVAGLIDTSTVTIVDSTNNGTLDVAETGLVTYTPDPVFFGLDTFLYTVADTLGIVSNVATVNISVKINAAPIAVDDTAGTITNQPIEIDLTANDSDPDGTIDSSSVAIVDSTNNGTLDVANTGLVTYTPDPEFFGLDTFQYTIDDNHGVPSNVATVTISVNAPPRPISDSFTMDEDTELSVPAPGVLGNDTDPNFDPLTAILQNEPNHGDLTLNQDGSFIYKPNENFNGIDSLSYAASDGIAQSEATSVTITVLPVNDSPVAVDDNFTVEENSSLQWPSPGVIGNDLDVDGDDLHATLVDGPSSGTLNLNDDGSFDYTPNANFIGVDGFTYSTTDGDSTSNQASVTLTIVPAGQSQWPSRLNGANDGEDRSVAIAIDDAGFLYITGWSFSDLSGFDYMTVKYSPNGVPLWIQRYNGPANREDRARAIALDSGGNVYVTGESKSDTSDFDFTTVKYDNTGNQVWVARHDGPDNGEDKAVALALDNSGNVCITGKSFSAIGGFDYMTLKYDSDGNMIFEHRYNGSGNNDDVPTSIATNNGNVYVTGWSAGSGSGLDYATLKYDAGGNLLWEQRYNGPANGDDKAMVLKLNEAGDVYVTGGSEAPGTGMDYETLKYSSDGIQIWQQRLSGQGNNQDMATALILDNSENIYVTGSSFENVTGFDFLTVRYFPVDGTPRWFRRFNSVENADDRPAAFALDAENNLHVTGVIAGDFGTLVYDPSGDLQLNDRFDGSASGLDEPTGIVLDNQGNMFITGGSQGIESGEDFLTIMYEPFIPVQSTDFEVLEKTVSDAQPVEGDTITYTIRATNLGPSAGTNVVISDLIPDDMAYLPETIVFNGEAKTDTADGDNADFGETAENTVTVNVGGFSIADTVTISFQIKVSETAGGITITNTASIAGEQMDSNSANDMASVDILVDFETSVSDRDPGGVPKEFSLAQNFPNPFNPSTTIQFAVPRNEHVTLKVFNVLGVEVATLVDEELSPGEYKINWKPVTLGSGVYILRLEARTFIQTQKMLFIK